MTKSNWIEKKLRVISSSFGLISWLSRRLDIIWYNMKWHLQPTLTIQSTAMQMNIERAVLHECFKPDAVYRNSFFLYPRTENSESIPGAEYGKLNKKKISFRMLNIFQSHGINVHFIRYSNSRPCMEHHEFQFLRTKQNNQRISQCQCVHPPLKHDTQFNWYSLVPRLHFWDHGFDYNVYIVS